MVDIKKKKQKKKQHLNKLWLLVWKSKEKFL